jgi:uncharacterized membrane protein YhaH (DUF805 family)
MQGIIFSSYKIVKNTHNATIKIMPYWGPLASLGQIFFVWVFTLIPTVVLYAFLARFHIPWQIFLIMSFLIVFILFKKFMSNVWGIDFLIFDKTGFFVSGNTASSHVPYSEVKTIEVHEVPDQKVYNFHFIMQKGDVLAMNIHSTSHEILEEIAQLIISQSLSKGLEEKHVSNNILRRVFDNLFSSRLNRKNYLVGMTLALLLLIDISLSSIIYSSATTNPVIEYILLISILIILVFYYSLVTRRGHDIGFAVNDPSFVTDNPFPTWYLQGGLIWFTIKLFFMESAKYENQYGKTPDQHLNSRNIFGLDRM